MRTLLKLKLTTPVLMWAIVIAGILILRHYLPARFLFRRNPLTSAILLLALANWIYFFFGALKVNRRPAGSAAVTNRLATSGVYAKVRHPIYSADIILAWGIFFFWPTVRTLASVVWLTIVLILWMKLEESALTEKFGEEYTHYKERTPMFIPKTGI